MRAALVFTALLLTVLIAAEWSLLPREPDLAGFVALQQDRVQPEKAGATAEFRLPALRVYREIEQRPLFSKQRRGNPPSARRKTRGPPSLNPAQLVVRAIVITPETRNAHLYDRKRHETLNVHRHERVQDWIVTEIEKNRVILSKGGQHITLGLRESSPSPKRPPSPASKNGVGVAHR